MPPKGEVSPSVLQAAALMFCYPALAFATKALDDNKKVKLSTKVGTITVGKVGEDGEDEVEMIQEGEDDDV